MVKFEFIAFKIDRRPEALIVGLPITNQLRDTYDEILASFRGKAATRELAVRYLNFRIRVLIQDGLDGTLSREAQELLAAVKRNVLRALILVY